MEDENWDDACAPAYIPSVEAKKVIKKTPARLSRSQKKAFYAQERLRWEQLKNSENEHNKSA